MKLLVCLAPLLVLPSFAYAEDLNKQINKACLRHAVSFVGNLKSEFGDIPQQQADKILNMATASCQAYMGKEFSVNTGNSQQNNEKQVLAEENQTGDEFTKRWFESADKDGNERLKKKR